jgi:hypothetical protein
MNHTRHPRHTREAYEIRVVSLEFWVLGFDRRMEICSAVQGSGRLTRSSELLLTVYSAAIPQLWYKFSISAVYLQYNFSITRFS